VIKIANRNILKEGGWGTEGGKKEEGEGQKSDGHSNFLDAAAPLLRDKTGLCSPRT